MSHHPACPDGAHVHQVGMLIIPSAYAVVDDTVGVIALDRAVADRVAELLNRHGLADVPDDASTITAPWPAPDPKDRHT